AGSPIGPGSRAMGAMSYGILLPITLAAGPGPVAAEEGGPAYAVLHVLNADSVVLKTPGGLLSIRRRGVAPVEAVAPGAYRDLAAQYLRKLLAGQAVRLEAGGRGERERDGRTPALLIRVSDGLAVNRAMVERGYRQAGADLEGERREEFLAAEEAART